MSGGGTTSTNTVQKSDPWSGAQPYLTDLMSQAQSLYNKGSSYAPFSTVAPLSPTTSLGLKLTQDRALNGSPLVNQADKSLTNLLQSGSSASPGNGVLASLMSHYNNMASDPAQQGANADPNSNPANQYLSQEAQFQNINPYLDQMYSAASRPVIDSINAQFSQGGRTGSAANQSVLAQNLGDLSANIYGNGYQNAVQNQQNAANSIQSAYDTGQNRNLSYTNLLDQISNEKNNQSLNAANALNSQTNTANQQKLTGAALAPQLAGQDYTDLQNLLSVGGAYDTQANNQIQDLLSRYNYGQQQPWNLLSQYGGVVSGLGNLGGTTNSTSTQPDNSTTSLIGGGMSMIGSLLPFFL